jgi:hypothetical protein
MTKRERTKISLNNLFTKDFKTMGARPTQPLPEKEDEKIRPAHLGNDRNHSNMARVPSIMGRPQRRPTWQGTE